MTETSGSGPRASSKRPQTLTILWPARRLRGHREVFRILWRWRSRPAPSWGSILSNARSDLTTAWWTGVFPGLAIVATVLSVNVIDERLRENLDPRFRGA